MGENILILAFVVIIIGGIGSIRGAFVASIFVGLVDTVGRAFLPDMLKADPEPGGRVDGGAGAVLDADLSGDGGRAGAAPGGPVPGRQQMTALLTPRNWPSPPSLALLLLVPVYAHAIGNLFLLSLFTRIVILAMAAVSLNLIMGFGGMVSFGHAAYIGIGGYVVGILAHEGVPSGFVQWPLALVVSALFALVIGALSPAHARRLLHHDHAGLRADDLLRGGRRSTATAATTASPSTAAASSAASLNLSNKTVFYYLCLALLLATVYLVWRLVNSRFGLVIQGARSNDRRMHAIGFPTYRYRLACFVIAGTICGLAGVLLANHTDFISPAMMHWTRSGDLIVMAVLGGMGSVFGPVIGALALLRAGGGAARSDQSRRFAGAWQRCGPRRRVLADRARPAAAARRAVRARRHRRHCWRGLRRA